MTQTPSELVAEYLGARDARDAATVRLEEVTDRLMKQMKADQRKSYRWEVEGIRHTLTYVQSHVTRIDERGLRRALRAKIFDRYTVRKLDRKAMEDAMDAGEVDPVIVSRFVQQQPNQPHLSYKVAPVRNGEVEES